MLVRGFNDDRNPRELGADSLTNDSGEFWALAEAFLWLRDESGEGLDVEACENRPLTWPCIGCMLGAMVRKPIPQNNIFSH